jgi:hypothetical protein
MLPKPGIFARASGKSLWAVRTLTKRYKDARPGSHNRPEFQRHRYPEISMEDMRSRVSRFQKILNDPIELQIEQVGGKFFRISAE